MKRTFDEYIALYEGLDMAFSISGHLLQSLVGWDKGLLASESHKSCFPAAS